LKEEVIGVIVVYMRQAQYEFTHYEVRDNFESIVATCSVALRKVRAKEDLQKLVDLLEMVHLANSKEEILDLCIDEMLLIFDAHSAIIYEVKEASGLDQNSIENFTLFPIYKRNIENDLYIPKEFLQNIKKLGPQTIYVDQFPNDWNSIREQFGQFIIFTLDFKEEPLGLVVLFTKKNTPLSLPESERKKLALAISRQLAIAFKNIIISKEIDKRRIAEPVIISAQYVSGMIHELASIAHKGRASATYIRGSEEFRGIDNRNIKIEMSKMESSFDDIGTFTKKALTIKDIGQMKFEEKLEYGSINKVVLEVLNDSASEIRKKVPKIETHFDKKLYQRHAFFDEILIKQSIRNLLYNSIRWIFKDGYIKISTNQKGDNIFVTVEDNGQGVKPEIKEYIFDPFFTTSPGGYGIGLFFVRSVAKMHKGDARLLTPKNPTSFVIKISSKLRKGG
jgi:hypothetical protein